jgi:transposase
MPRQAKLAEYLSQKELKEKYLMGEDRVERRRYQLLWLVSQSWTIKKAAQAVGISYDYGQKIVRAYNKEGVRGIRHRRREIIPPGKPELLDKEQQEKLKQCLQASPEDGGIWTGPKVAQWIARETGREKVWPQRGWDYLKRLGFS